MVEIRALSDFHSGPTYDPLQLLQGCMVLTPSIAHAQDQCLGMPTRVPPSLCCTTLYSQYLAAHAQDQYMEIMTPSSAQCNTNSKLIP